MRLLMVRHAQTAFNLEGRVLGRTDLSLTEFGRRQAEALGDALADEPVAAVYASPLARAVQTAQCIAARHDLPVQAVSELREVDAGELEGLLSREMGERYPSFIAQWRQDPLSVPMPRGDSLREVQARAWSILEAWREHHASQTVVAVTHNFVILTLICRMLCLPPSSLRQVRIDLATISEIVWRDGRWVIQRLNDACHLRDLSRQ